MSMNSEQAAVALAVKDAWEWNKEQQEGIKLARSGKSFCLIGAAGTGKTSTEKEITRILVSEGIVRPINLSTKYLQHGLPGIVVTSYTRRAVRASRRVQSADIQPHCITMHKVLEFEPVFYEVWDEESQKNRVTMRFEPQRNNLRKLPDTLTTVIIDEASMPSVDLFMQFLAALPNPDKVQFIFVGDLHQLPPVYGQAILGFKLLELPVVELKHIYRQAQNSPIIALAHKIKNGEAVPVKEKITTVTDQGKVTIHPWKKQLSDFDATHTASLFLKKLVTEGDYDEEEDIILCPQEKVSNLAFGTNEFNRVVAQALGEKRKATVFEVIAGFQKHYYAVGDRVMVGREDAVITNISRNARYWSRNRPRPASEFLDRWGAYKQKPTEEVDDADFDADAFLDSFTLKSESEEDRKQEASHVITVELLDTGQSESLDSAGDINAMAFAYCLTVHKAQGSEWRRVFFLTHQSHITMWSRELLYTAVTRAREELYIICEPDRPGKDGTLTKAARSPRIKGDTLAEKAEFFKGKSEDYNKKLEATLALPQGSSVSGVYKGQVDKAPVAPITPTPAPVKLVKLSELVSSSFKEDANKMLDIHWSKAKNIYGDRIGAKPVISYDLQKAKTIGLASLGIGVIKLNPAWCILGEETPAVRDEMLVGTLIHEVAHFVAYRFSSERGHGSGWKMAMKLMGITPEEDQANAGKLPRWAEGYQAGVEMKMQELKEKQGADVEDDYTPNNFDEV